MENMKKEVRNISVDGDDEKEDEMKMEKFYSLLRSFRDARDRRRRELQELEKNETNKKKKMKTTTDTSNPKVEASFEWQDFTTDIHFRKPPSIFPNPIPSDRTIKDDNRGKKKEHALDLKLAL